MSHLIFIVNEMMLNGNKVTGLDIAKELVTNKHWRYTYSTPNWKKIRPGDEVIVYIAGKGFRCFLSRFTIGSKITEAQNLSNTLIGSALAQIFPLESQIEKVQIWEKPLPILTIKENLCFISDKKNWGLFFRQSVKLIHENDYNLIVSAATEYNSILPRIHSNSR